MSVMRSILLYLAKKMGLELQDKPPQKDDYSSMDAISLTAVIANKVATLAMQDSNIAIEGDSARAALIQEFLDYYLGDRMDVAAEVALGTGDCLIKPYTDGRRFGVDLIKNGDFVVCESIGNSIISCIIKSGEYRTEHGAVYQRYEIEMVRDAVSESGREGSALLVYNVAFKNNKEVPLEEVEAWKGIPPFLMLPNVSKPLFGRYKCPAVDRRDVNGVNGVKITSGADRAMALAVEAYERFNKEYQSKETMIFADKTILTKDTNGNLTIPDNKRNLFLQMRGNGADGKKLIQEYSPEIRSGDLEAGITVNNRMVELLTGLSPGILTPPTTSYATATEMRAALNATFAVITKFRRSLTKGTNDLLDAVDIIANRNNMTPMGAWRAKYDWSAAYIEQLNEQFNQLMMAEGIGAVEKAEVRAWLLDEDYETAKTRVDEIAEETGAALMAGAIAEGRGEGMSNVPAAE